MGSAIASNFSNNAKTSIPLDQLSASKWRGAVCKGPLYAYGLTQVQYIALLGLCRLVLRLSAELY